jgi:hypothetical protein
MLDRRPLRIAKRLRRTVRRGVGVQLERQPARRDAELLRCLFDPDRAEIAKRSNDVGPDQQNTRAVHARYLPGRNSPATIAILPMKAAWEACRRGVEWAAHRREPQAPATKRGEQPL